MLRLGTMRLLDRPCRSQHNAMILFHMLNGAAYLVPGGGTISIAQPACGPPWNVRVRPAQRLNRACLRSTALAPELANQLD